MAAPSSYSITILALALIAHSSASAQTYTQRAEAAMTAHPSPVEFEEPGAVGNVGPKEGVTQFFACATDDAWVHPFIEVYKGANGGFDICWTVDTAQAKPGLGEIDAHVGGKAPTFTTWPPAIPNQVDARGDYHMLGDARVCYYAGKSASGDAEADFVYIYRFEAGYSRVRLHGAAADYVLAQAVNPETGLAGTSIFRTAEGTEDLIGHIDGFTPAQVPLNGGTFVFATPLSTTPAVPGAKQIGTRGLNLFGRIAVDADGSIYQTFLTSGDPVQNESGSGSMLLVKYAPDGTRAWTTRHGAAVNLASPTNTNHGELPYNITVSGQFIFVSGHTKGAFGGAAPVPGRFTPSLPFFAKFSKADGSLLDVRRFYDQPENSTAWTCIVDDTGTQVFAGGGTSANGPGFFPDTSPFVKILRQSDLAQLSGSVITNGQPFVPGAHPEYNQVSNECIARPAFYRDGGGNGFYFAGGYASSGDFLGGPRGHTSAWIAKYDQAGTRLWGHAFSSPTGNQYAHGISVDTQGNSYIIGQTYGPLGGDTAWGEGDGFIRKYNASGTVVWTRLVGTTASDDLHGIDIVNGVIYLTGTTYGSLAARNAGLSDGFIVTMDLDGNLLGAHQFGTDALDFTRDIFFRNGRLILGGMTEGSLGAPASGGMDVFICDFDPAVLTPRNSANLRIVEGDVDLAFQLTDSPASYVVKESTDLTNWSSLATGTTRNYFHRHITPKPAGDRRFYRIEWTGL